MTVDYGDDEDDHVIISPGAMSPKLAARSHAYALLA